MSMGYLNRNEGYGSVNQELRRTTSRRSPAWPAHNVPPQMTFGDGFAQFGSNAGINIGNVTTRPTFIINDMVTWTKGAHTIKVGMEYRKIMGNIHNNGNQAGTLQLRPRRRPGSLGVNVRQPDRQLPARRGRQRQRDVPRRRRRPTRGRTRGSSTPATPGASTTSSRSTTACAGTTTRRRPRSTTCSRSSIRTAPTPARAAARAVSRSPATATAPTASARRIPRTTGTAGSRRVWARSTR